MKRRVVVVVVVGVFELKQNDFKQVHVQILTLVYCGDAGTN